MGLGSRFFLGVPRALNCRINQLLERMALPIGTFG